MNNNILKDDIEFMVLFNTLAVRVSNDAKDHGWEDNWNDGEKIALMHSELSEALESLRHDNPPDDHIPEFSGVEAELADVIIRIMHFAAYRKLAVAEAIIAKIDYNKSRPYKHGGKKF